jgi:hypothetical protein
MPSDPISTRSCRPRPRRILHACGRVLVFVIVLVFGVSGSLAQRSERPAQTTERPPGDRACAAAPVRTAPATITEEAPRTLAQESVWHTVAAAVLVAPLTWSHLSSLPPEDASSTMCH